MSLDGDPFRLRSPKGSAFDITLDALADEQTDEPGDRRVANVATIRWRRSE